MKIVHLICNAHLDPVWLWSWKDGVDEAVNTCHYICGLLDRHPDVIYTRGESWVYEWIRELDPSLFERIKAHIAAGRWNPVGGWYIQPDCNLPSGFAMQRQIALGKRFFREHLGGMPTVAYNVDSFGHSAALPGLMRSAGQSAYVMMRPQEHEMNLPARIFRWAGYDGGPEVVTFRIATAYCTPNGLKEEHVLSSLSDLPEGIHHTMCFVGIGDHGGGPTEDILDWCRKKQDTIPGVRLTFSSPQKFFSAIQPDLAKLPLVIGELQHHAVGCYSVHRKGKVLLRRAEHRLVQAELAHRSLRPTEAAELNLDPHWQTVCFSHFHDILGGTSLPSAHEETEADLGGALAAADRIAATALRWMVCRLPNDPAQRLIFHNASEQPFDDFVEIEPWLEWTAWDPAWRLVNEHDEEVAYQVIPSEGDAGIQARLIFSISLPAQATKTLRIVEDNLPGESTTSDQSPHDEQPAWCFSDQIGWREPDTLRAPELVLYEDRTDTWSHGIDRFTSPHPQTALWDENPVQSRGPIMTSLRQKGKIGESILRAEWRSYTAKPWVDLCLRIRWNEEFHALKLSWEIPGSIIHREDGIMSGSLNRQPDGRELPVRDWVRVETARQTYAVIAPEVFALDVTTECINLTLLRSPLMAWHEPNPGDAMRGTFSDRGEHVFRFRFLTGAHLNGETMDRMALGMHRPLLAATTTRGMSKRALRGEYQP